MLAVPNSPLAAAGVMVAAQSGALFRMVGPIYGTEVGLKIDQIAYFLTAFVLGGALAQIPVGWLAEKYDRRNVLIWLSVAAVMSCLATILVSGYSTTTIFLTALFFGITTFPIFSVLRPMPMILSRTMSGLNCLPLSCSILPSARSPHHYSPHS